MAMAGLATPKRPRPKAVGSRRSGRAGEPAAGESVRASESLDDVPQDPRLPSYPPLGPTDRLRDLYGSLSARLGISSRGGGTVVGFCTNSDVILGMSAITVVKRGWARRSGGSDR